MSILEKKNRARARRATRVRGKVRGTAERPRLTVFRSNRSIWVQVIDDSRGHTLAAASSNDLDEKGLAKKDQATKVGELIAARAKAAGIDKVVFDRGGYLYHGRIAAVAAAAREAGLEF